MQPKTVSQFSGMIAQIAWGKLRSLCFLSDDVLWVIQSKSPNLVVLDRQNPTSQIKASRMLIFNTCFEIALSRLVSNKFSKRITQL